MGSTTGIQWTNATWNPWRGCDKVSPGCAHCYMFTEQSRYGQDPSVVVRCSPSTFNAPLSKRWRDRLPAGSHVFTCSWSDWFHEDADQWRDEAWDVVRQCPQWNWQILTKRPERMLEHLPADWGAGWTHVWLGVSVENRRFVHRADILREVPAAMRFVSAEPLLRSLVCPRCHGRGWIVGFDGTGVECTRCDGVSQQPGRRSIDLTGIDWCIIGGESGPRARPMQLGWALDLVEHCRRAGCRPFVKQLGAVLGSALDAGPKGDRIDRWPEYLRVREMPKVAAREQS